MPLQISIPTPCHEDWNKMTSADKGRHCSQCNKTVVDFTALSTQEIGFYLSEHTSEKLCGRFNAEQIEDPVPTPEDFVKQLSYFRLPMLKKIAAIFLFAFSVMASSCNDEIANGGVAGNLEINTIQTDSIQRAKDSIQNSLNPVVVGEPAISPVDSIPKPNKPTAKTVCVKNFPEQIMGDMVMMPVPDTVKEITVKDVPPLLPDTSVIMGKIKKP